jgi:2',3'-cyclic-nucleotide 2'-phosphodiesterase (5'-nucleotidase family)
MRDEVRVLENFVSRDNFINNRNNAVQGKTALDSSIPKDTKPADIHENDQQDIREEFVSSGFADNRMPEDSTDIGNSKERQDVTFKSEEKSPGEPVVVHEEKINEINAAISQIFQVGESDNGEKNPDSLNGVQTNGITPVTLTVVHTNDIHGKILPWTDVLRDSNEKVSFGGAPVLMSLIDKIRMETLNEGKNFLLLDAGDAYAGISTPGKVDNMFLKDIMNLQGYDAMTMGNHDLDGGLDKFLEFVKEADFPVLTANATDQDGNRLEGVLPYVIKEMKDLKVGVVGVITPETGGITSVEDVKRMKFSDPVKTLEEVIPKMKKEGASLIIVLSHCGFDEDKRIAGELKEQNIALIIGGHSHHRLDEPVLEGNTYIVQAGTDAKNVGKVDLQWDPLNNKLLSASGRLIPAGSESAEPDPEVQSIIDKFLSMDKDLYTMSLGRAAENLHRPHDGGESNLGNVITDLMRESTDADLALLNSGCLRSSLAEGNITYADIINVLPLETEIVLLEMNGSHILQALERSAGDSDDKSLQVSGLNIIYDSSRPEGERMISVKLKNGEDISPDKNYRVASIDYLAEGGDGYEMFTHARELEYEKISIQQEVLRHLETKGMLSPSAMGRMRNVRE